MEECKAITLAGKKCKNKVSGIDEDYCWRHRDTRRLETERDKRRLESERKQQLARQREIEWEQRRQERERRLQEQRRIAEAKRRDYHLQKTYQKYIHLLRQQVPNDEFTLAEILNFEQRKYGRRIDGLMKKGIRPEILRGQLRQIRHLLFYQRWHIHMIHPNPRVFIEEWIDEPTQREMEIGRGYNNGDIGVFRTIVNGFIDAQNILMAVLDFSGKLRPVDDLRLVNIADERLMYD